MDDKYIVLALVIGVLIGYILCKAISGSGNIIKDVAINHPACF
jgi:uncharacterized membrane-anchored protein YhcB (DUF1043 family)